MATPCLPLRAYFCRSAGTVRIKIDTPQLVALSTKLGIGSDEYKQYLDLERAYLVALQTEPDDVKATVDYMEHLFELDNFRYIENLILKGTFTDNSFCRQKNNAATAQYKQRDFLMTNRGYTGKQITKIDTQYQMAFERWKAKNDEVLLYEEERNIAIHWAPTSQEYLDALTIVHE